jgi:DMSO/TMAO reductase YedYZ heme-binding membrane subunit
MVSDFAQARRRSSFERRRIVYAAALGVGALCGLVLATEGVGEAGVRACIRATARSSLALLVLVFPLSAVRRRWPSPATGWLLRNRRYLGLSLAVSHGYHLLFIGVLYSIGRAGDVPQATVYGGGFGFVMLAAMAVTSNDTSQRRLGASWRRLHWVGLYTVWIVFAVSYMPDALPDAGRAAIPTLASGLLVGALLLRVWPARRAKRQNGRDARK